MKLNILAVAVLVLCTTLTTGCGGTHHTKAPTTAAPVPKKVLTKTVYVYTTEDEYTIIVDSKYKHPQIVQFMRGPNGELASETILPRGDGTFRVRRSPDLNWIPFQVQVDDETGGGRRFLTSEEEYRGWMKAYDESDGSSRLAPIWTGGLLQGGQLFKIEEATTYVVKI